MPKCKKCGNHFSTAQQLRVHRWAVHGGPYPFRETKNKKNKKKHPG